MKLFQFFARLEFHFQVILKANIQNILKQIDYYLSGFKRRKKINNALVFVLQKYFHFDFEVISEQLENNDNIIILHLLHQHQILISKQEGMKQLRQ